MIYSRDLFYQAYQNFRYDPKTGEMWTRESGELCREIEYRSISVALGGKKYSLQRVAWLMRYGVLPQGKGNKIFHLNGNKLDNRMENLRKKDKGGAFFQPKDAYPEISWEPPANSWAGYLRVNGKFREVVFDRDFDGAAVKLFFLEFEYREKYMRSAPPSPTEVYVMWNGLLEVKT